MEGIATKRTRNLVKENEALKVALSKATAKIHALKVEKSLLINHILKHTPAKEQPQLTLDLQHSKDPTQEDPSALAIDSEPSLLAIQERITKALLQTFHFFPGASSCSCGGGSTDPSNSSSQSNAAKRKRPGADLKKVPFDDEGRAIMPLQLGILTIHNLGAVQHGKPAFQSKRYIWPLGFLSSRPYASYLDPSAANATYFSRVSASADGNAPKFEVWIEGEPERVFSASTPTGAWSSVIRLVNEMRGRETASNSASGPDLFGFSNATVAKLLEEMNKGAAQ